MVYIRSRTFCCCIPVRFGVFILSLLGVIGGGIVSAAGWVQVYQLKNQAAGTADTIATWLHASLFTLLTLLSIFGFIGCLIKSRNSVYAYSWGLLIFIFASILSGSFTLWAIFNKPYTRADYVECLNGATDEAAKSICRNENKIYKGVAVAIYIIMWLLMIYAYVIIDNYVDQLDEEMYATETRDMMSTIGQPRVTVQPVAVPAYASFGPSAQRSATGYSFSQQNQSFGKGTRPNGSVV